MKATKIQEQYSDIISFPTVDNKHQEEQGKKE